MKNIVSKVVRSIVRCAVTIWEAIKHPSDLQNKFILSRLVNVLLGWPIVIWSVYEACQGHWWTAGIIYAAGWILGVIKALLIDVRLWKEASREFSGSFQEAIATELECGNFSTVDAGLHA